MMLVKYCILVLVFIKQVAKEVAVMIVFAIMVMLFFVQVDGCLVKG
jgi:hypothetical protein